MTYPDKSDMRRSLTGYAVGMGAWIVAAAILIFAAALVVFASDDPDSALVLPSLAALYLSALIAGICSAAVGGKITSVIFTALSVCAVVLLAASFKPDGAQSFDAVACALMYTAIPAAALGGGALTLFIRKRKEAKPKRRNRRRR